MSAHIGKRDSAVKRENRKARDATSMRPRAGDLYVELNNGEGTIRMLLERESVDDVDRAFVKSLMVDHLGPFIAQRSTRKRGGR